MITPIAMTNAEAIVAAAFILAVAAVVLLIVWQLIGIVKRGLDQRVEDRNCASYRSAESNRGPDDR